MQATVNKVHNGFTLIELLIVMVLLSIFLAIAIPKYEDLSGQALIVAQQGTAEALKTAWSDYMTAHGGALPTNTALVTELINLTGDKHTGCHAGVKGGVICTFDNHITYLISTYKDLECTVSSVAPSDKIACVGK